MTGASRKLARLGWKEKLHGHAGTPEEENPDVANNWLAGQVASIEGAEPVLLSGHTAAAVCALALEARANLLVAAAHRGFVKRLALGSFATYIAYHAPCPVLIARPPG